MKQGITKYLTVIFLLFWAVASSPFLSVLAISFHGNHNISLLPQSGNFEITFEHEHETDSHSHDHEGDSETHHAQLTFGVPVTQLQISYIVPKPQVVFSLPVLFSLHIGLFNHSEHAVFGGLLDRIDKLPASQLAHKLTVLLV